MLVHKSLDERFLPLSLDSFPSLQSAIVHSDWVTIGTTWGTIVIDVGVTREEGGDDLNGPKSGQTIDSNRRKTCDYGNEQKLFLTWERDIWVGEKKRLHTSDQPYWPSLLTVGQESRVCTKAKDFIVSKSPFFYMTTIKDRGKLGFKVVEDIRDRPEKLPLHGFTRT